MTLQAHIVLILAVIVFSFTAGWEVATWKNNSRALAAESAAVAEHRKKEADTVQLTRAYEQQLADLRTKNATLARRKNNAKDTDCTLPADALQLLQGRASAADTRAR